MKSNPIFDTIYGLSVSKLSDSLSLSLFMQVVHYLLVKFAIQCLQGTLHVCNYTQMCLINTNLTVNCLLSLHCIMSPLMQT